MNQTTIKKDEQNATLSIERVFDAPRSRVWQAFTDTEFLDRWWAPAPWKTQTLSMDFRVGGRWHYSMNGPKGEQHFGRLDYLEIEPESRFKAFDVFADADGEAVPTLPKQTSVSTFSDEDQSTKVIVVVEYASPEDLQKVIEMGIEQGISMAHDQLEGLLHDSDGLPASDA